MFPQEGPRGVLKTTHDLFPANVVPGEGAHVVECIERPEGVKQMWVMRGGVREIQCFVQPPGIVSRTRVEILQRAVVPSSRSIDVSLVACSEYGVFNSYDRGEAFVDLLERLQDRTDGLGHAVRSVP